MGARTRRIKPKGTKQFTNRRGRTPAGGRVCRIVAYLTAEEDKALEFGCADDQRTISDMARQYITRGLEEDGYLT